MIKLFISMYHFAQTEFSNFQFRFLLWLFILQEARTNLKRLFHFDFSYFLITMKMILQIIIAFVLKFTIFLLFSLHGQKKLEAYILLSGENARCDYKRNFKV